MKYSKETNELLCAMLNENGIDKSLFPHDTLKTLFDNGVIRNSSDYHNNNVYLTDKGMAYAEELLNRLPKPFHKKCFHWVKNNILEIIAIIISIIALLKP